MADTLFAPVVESFAAELHNTAKAKGWWDTDRSDGEAIALMHSELSEALEASREGNPPDKHLPHYSSMTVELADAIIRILDFAEARGLPVAKAVVEKAEFNKSRSYKHGKKF